MDATRRRLAGSMALMAAFGPVAGSARAAEVFAVTRSDEEWLALLGRNRFGVLRRSATERPHTSRLNDEHRTGVFHCAGCELPLFSSSVKFESGTGWPSFAAPLANAVGTTIDR